MLIKKTRNYENDVIQKQGEKAINIFMCIFINLLFELCARPLTGERTVLCKSPRHIFLCNF